MKRCYSAFIIIKNQIVQEIVGTTFSNVKYRADNFLKNHPEFSNCEIRIDETTDKYVIEEEYCD